MPHFINKIQIIINNTWASDSLVLIFGHYDKNNEKLLTIKKHLLVPIIVVKSINYQ